MGSEEQGTGSRQRPAGARLERQIRKGSKGEAMEAALPEPGPRRPRLLGQPSACPQVRGGRCQGAQVGRNAAPRPSCPPISCLLWEPEDPQYGEQLPQGPGRAGAGAKLEAEAAFFLSCARPWHSRCGGGGAREGVLTVLRTGGHTGD